MTRKMRAHNDFQVSGSGRLPGGPGLAPRPRGIYRGPGNLGPEYRSHATRDHHGQFLEKLDRTTTPLFTKNHDDLEIFGIRSALTRIPGLVDGG